MKGIRLFVVMAGMLMLGAVSCTDDKGFNASDKKIDPTQSTGKQPTALEAPATGVPCGADQKFGCGATTDPSDPTAEVDCTKLDEATCRDKKVEANNAPSFRNVDCAGLDNARCRDAVKAEKLADGQNSSQIRVKNCLNTDGSSCDESILLEQEEKIDDQGIDIGEEDSVKDPNFPEEGFCSAGPAGRVQSAFVTQGEATSCTNSWGYPGSQTFACKCTTGSIGGGCRILNPRQYPNGLSCQRR